MKKLLLTLCCLLTISARLSFACSANYQYQINSIVPPVVAFSDSSMGTAPISYIWNFGDGTNDNIANPVHTFPSTGVYNVCLIIHDNAGCTDSICTSVNVNLPAPTVSAFIMADSMNMYNCTSPATIAYYCGFSTTGFTTSDTILCDINFGDGVDSIFYITLASSPSFNSTVSHAYLNAGNYTAVFTATGAGNITSSFTSNPVIVAAACGTISGTVYNDINGNCIYDPGEELPNIPLYVYSSAVLMGWANSDVNGNYSFNVPSGSTYDVVVSATGGYTGHYSPSCPVSGSAMVSTLPATGIDFGLTCPVGFDLTGNITGWHFRPGDSTYACVYIYNKRCNSPTGGQVQVTLPADFTPLPDSTSSYTINGNTVTYPINGPALSWQFCIHIAVSTSAQIGDTACAYMAILPVIGDSMPLDNSGTFCFNIVNSYDPNEKYVTPQGDGVSGSILPNTQLTYNVEFQNTGNADAINIFILDTLSANLDPASVEVIASSHPLQWALLTGNILRFTFDNINLPPSSAHELQSHGYVTYRINQLPNLPQLTQISNSASIYFDYNAPIITNTTLNTIDRFLSVQNIQNHSSLVNIYPNPANGTCTIFFNDIHKRVMSVSDIVGKEVFSTTSTSDNYVLNTEKFAEGIYTIHISDDRNITDTGKMVVVH